MRHLITMFLASLLIACGGGGGSEEPEQEQAAPNCSVTVWGDSIGLGLAAEIAKARPLYRTVDRAMSGTSAQGRYAEFMAAPIDTRVSIIQWGMNDLAYTTAAEHGARIGSMIQHVQAGGGVALVTGISRTYGYYDTQRDAMDFAARDATVKGGAVFADWGAVPYSPSEIPDTIHPDAAYKARLVGQLLYALDVAAPECGG
jgi:hypothetical protein